MDPDNTKATAASNYTFPVQIYAGEIQDTRILNLRATREVDTPLFAATAAL